MTFRVFCLTIALIITSGTPVCELSCLLMDINVECEAELEKTNELMEIPLVLRDFRYRPNNEKHRRKLLLESYFHAQLLKGQSVREVSKWGLTESSSGHFLQYKLSAHLRI